MDLVTYYIATLSVVPHVLFYYIWNIVQLFDIM